MSLSPQLELIGLAAGTLTTFCWLPQTVKILRTHDTRAISLVTQSMFTLGCALWLAYGIALASPSLIIFNIVTTALAASITLLKMRYG